MSLKLKVMGLGVLAIMAMGAFAVMTASAENSGHFTSEVEQVTVEGLESGIHRTKYTVPGLKPIECTKATYHGLTPKAATKTWTSIDITPTYSECHTEGGAAAITVHTNGCFYRFTVGKNSQAHNTVDIVCNGGGLGWIALTHEGCEIRITPQTVGGAANNGVVYTTTVEGKHTITLDTTITGIKAEFEAGFCVLLGTNQVTSFSGSVTVKGIDPVTKNQVGITATGSVG